MNGVKIIDPGLATSIQDKGRTGYLRYGVPACGALDVESMRIANALVGNDPDTPALEIRFLGPSFKVSTERLRIACSGASIGLQVERDGETIIFGEDRSLTLLNGDRVSVGPLRNSSTAYLAVEGGFKTESVLGSTSTDIKSGISGFGGRKIEARMQLPVRQNDIAGQRDMALPVARELGSGDPVRVVLGPQDDYFTRESLDAFLSVEWIVSPQADRMGMRLDGPALKHANGHDIASDGIANGAIQVPGNGQPIILLADRQTSGGYPKIATIISCDLPGLGRITPGSKIQFVAVSASEAVTLVRKHENKMQDLLASIALYHPPGEINLETLAAGNLISAPIGMD